MLRRLKHETPVTKLTQSFESVAAESQVTTDQCDFTALQQTTALVTVTVDVPTGATLGGEIAVYLIGSTPDGESMVVLPESDDGEIGKIIPTAIGISRVTFVVPVTYCQFAIRISNGMDDTVDMGVRVESQALVISE